MLEWQSAKLSPAAVNGVTQKIIGAAIEVHRSLGPGLLETAYEECLCYELASMDLRFQRQAPIANDYKSVRLDCGYRADLIVENTVLLELKSIERLLPIHEAQLMTYLCLADLSVGLLINFNVLMLKQGIKRITHNLYPSMVSARIMTRSRNRSL